MQLEIRLHLNTDQEKERFLSQNSSQEHKAVHSSLLRKNLNIPPSRRRLEISKLPTISLKYTHLTEKIHTSTQNKHIAVFLLE